ncbi:hypothetical protein LINPERPRIM_LOCUS37035 [Linum perenne]
MQWPKIIYETDCLNVVHGVRREEESHTEFGELITRCRTALRMQPQAEVVFVRRDGNRAAHTVARRSIQSVGLDLGSTSPDWFLDVLADVCPILDH